MQVVEFHYIATETCYYSMIDCYSSEGDAATCKILQTGRFAEFISNVMCLVFGHSKVIGQLLNNDLSVMLYGQTANACWQHHQLFQPHSVMTHRQPLEDVVCTRYDYQAIYHVLGRCSGLKLLAFIFYAFIVLATMRLSINFCVK